MSAAPTKAPLRRALISVSDKTGLVAFATALAERGGRASVDRRGTATTLREAGLTVTDVAEVTGFPEMMDGRVKTLHPKVHGGLLALRGQPRACRRDGRAHGIGAIDLLAVNLYPFEDTVAGPARITPRRIENIDIGGARDDPCGGQEPRPMWPWSWIPRITARSSPRSTRMTVRHPTSFVRPLP